ncbi:MAG: glycosyltransferase family 4 protein [Bacteroidales bacterium]|nr:glycosyltransferase family 4 protein [Bacteroidales bacterium]
MDSLLVKRNTNLLSESDILIFPSLSEGLPLTVLESMMYGLPVISRPVGGIPDVIDEGINGYLTDRNEPEVFAEILQNLINKPLLYSSISRNNMNVALQFSPLEMQKRLFSVYRSVIVSTK